MPASICGSWEMISNVNMEGYMMALGKFLCMLYMLIYMTVDFLYDALPKCL